MYPCEACGLSVSGTTMEITPSMGSAVPLERNDNASALHNYEPLMDYFGDEIANEPDVIGRWESKLPLAALYIEFREKGPVTILLQKQDEPMQLIRGYWKERDDGSIYILGYRAGWGDMPFEYNLTWSTVNGTLVLEDVDNDYKLLPVYNVMEFEPVSDGWTFPDLSAGRVYDDSLIWEIFYDEGKYTDEFENEWEYSFYTPQLTATTPEAEIINEEIRQNCGDKIFEAYGDMEQHYGLNFYDIHWASYWHDTMVSLVIEMDSNMSFTDYYVCNYDFSMGRSVPNFELLQRFGLTSEEFIPIMKEAALKYYDDMFAEVPDEYKDEFYNRQREWTGSDENINTNLMMFIDEDGELAVVTPIGSIAGANWYYHIVKPLAQD